MLYLAIFNVGMLFTMLGMVRRDWYGATLRKHDGSMDLLGMGFVYLQFAWSLLYVWYWAWTF